MVESRACKNGVHSMSIKDINQHRILELIRLYAGISRTEIVDKTDLSKATISKIVSTFIEAGIINELGAGPRRARAGRRLVRLELNRQIRLVIGMELTGSECIASLVDLYAQPIRTIRYPTVETSVDVSVDLLVRAVDQLMDSYDRSKLIGVGIGVPGEVDLSRQTVMQAVNIAWFNVPLGKLLTEKINKPVTVIKRQSAGALGEYRIGVGKDKDNLLYISVGVGIGSGIITRGQLYEGNIGRAGEIGHIVIVPNGNLCHCGNRGCLETLASCSAVVIRAREKIKEGRETIMIDWSQGRLESISFKMVLEAALQGDLLAIEIIQESARYLGMAIANAINLFDPAIVIIGGYPLELGDLYLGPVRDIVKQQTISGSLAAVDIKPSNLRDLAASIGAAILVIDNYFTLPNLFHEELNEGHA